MSFSVIMKQAFEPLYIKIIKIQCRMDDNYSKIFNHMIVTFGKFNNKKLDSGEQINFGTNHISSILLCNIVFTYDIVQFTVLTLDHCVIRRSSSSSSFACMNLPNITII